MKSEEKAVQTWRGVSWDSKDYTPAEDQDSVKVLQQAIMGEAEEEAQHILAEARSHAEDIREDARAQAKAEQDVILERARKKSEVLRTQAIAAAQIEAQKLKLRRREELLKRVFNDARQQLASLTERPDYEQTARRLVRQGMERMTGDEILVRTDSNTRKVLDDAALAELGEELGVHLRAGEPLTGSIGVVLETPDGHCRYDNTLETRLTRMQDSLRTPVYRVLTGETP